MKTERITLKGIPALLIGEPSRKVYLYVHGKMGSKEEALAFAEQACPAGYQVLAIDLPEHGERKNGPERLLPWVVIPELQFMDQYARVHWRQVSLRATSIGAWFSMLALQEKALRRALFVSPIVDMEDLIGRMMQQANVTEEQLQAAGEIPTDFGETLSWSYLCWVREHPLRWRIPTQVLYGEADELTSYAVLDRFKRATGAQLTLLADGGNTGSTPRRSWPCCRPGKVRISEAQQTEIPADGFDDVSGDFLCFYERIVKTAVIFRPLPRCCARRWSKP